MRQLMLLVFVSTCILITLANRDLPYKIKGPKSYDDKIAIVGAGPAGIHMANLLKQKGFKNLHIFEKSSRIGGKSETVSYRGIPHDIGTVYLSPDYEDTIIKLVKDYVPGDLVLFPPASIWLDKLPGPVSYQMYMGGFAMKVLKTKNPMLAAMKIKEAIIKYVMLHQQLFGAYDGEIMPEPTKETFMKIQGTFLEFIMRNQLTLLIPIFQASTTMQGYGQLDEISALYGLMWNTPSFMKGFIGRLEGKSGKTGMYMLKSGFQNLWETIVKKENLKVTFNVNIYSTYRAYKNDCQDVWMYKKEGNSKPGWEHFDFLIWSPEMKTSIARWRNVIPTERKLFDSTNPTYFTASIVDTENERRGQTPINYWMDNMLQKRENSVWAQRDSYSSLNQYSGVNYTNGIYPTGTDKNETKTCVVYQMGKDKIPRAKLENIIENHVKKIGATNVSIIKTKTWRYFPRYSPEDMEKGYLWRILELQGKHAMWYIGSSVCFESVKSVAEYNELLIRNMMLPTS